MTRRPDSGKFASHKLTAKEKRAKILELRKLGMTLDQIAQHMGYATRQSVHYHLNKALEEQPRQDAELLLRLELARLDTMQLALAERIRDGDVPAINAGISVMDRRAKYVGLDDYEKRMADLAERKAELDSEIAAQIQALLGAVFERLGLTPAQQVRVPVVVLESMRELGFVDHSPEPETLKGELTS